MKTMGFKNQFDTTDDYIQQRVDSFLPSILEIMDNYSALPYEEVVKQNELSFVDGGEEGSDDDIIEDSNFYFLGNGKCKVSVKNRKGKDVFVRELEEGDHFGEVSLIFNC